MATTVPGFPNKAQSLYSRIPKDLLPGDVWEDELYPSRQTGGLLASVTPVQGVWTAQIGAFSGGDLVGVTINGATIAVTATTDANTTAGLLNAAINAAVAMQGVVSSTVATDTVTITAALNVDVTVVEFSPAATSATVVNTVTAVVQPKACFGFGMARDIPSAGINRKKIRPPSSLADAFAGVVYRTKGSELTPDMISNYDATLDTRFLLPGQTYAVAEQNKGVVVEYVGTAPTESDDVYWIKTGVNAGKWGVTDGGTSEVVTLTLTTTAADTVAFNYDGLPDLSITSAGGVEADDAAALYALWIGNAAYAALGSIVDNLDGTLTITFSDTTTHTFTDNSTGTSSIAEVVDTVAVAVNAQLMPDFSWGRPSIEASEDAPARAFLRLSNP